MTPEMMFIGMCVDDLEHDGVIVVAEQEGEWNGNNQEN